MRGQDEWLSPARVQKPAYSFASVKEKGRSGEILTGPSRFISQAEARIVYRANSS